MILLQGGASKPERPSGRDTASRGPTALVRPRRAVRDRRPGLALRPVFVGRTEPPAPQTRPSIFQPIVFALQLMSGVIACALVALALWNLERPRQITVVVPAPQVAETDDPGESVRYRRAPARARGWEAQAVQSDRVPPINFPRAVKTVRIIPPSQSDVTASIAPVTVAALGPEVPVSRPPLAAPMGKAPEVKNWRYQLQGVNPATIAKSSSDLVVIDYSNGDRPFTRAEVEQMRRKPDGSRRIVLSYMSIGEAEDYRWYWQNRSSSWLGKENPKWKGNYGVRFWHEDWQKIVFEYTDKILAAGFDGVYLDKVDEYEEMGHKDEMVEFVARIGERAKAQRGDFLIVSQNGDQLIPNPKFRKAIDAFAREDLYYGEDSDGKRNKASSIRESVARLKLLTAEGKPVFVVEYPKNDKQAKTATHEISQQGFVGLMARRSLDVLER